MDTLTQTELGPYRLIEVIRRGGMATVYKAEQASLNRYVAVKVLEHHHDKQFVERFKAEARIIAQLQHPNILQIHDYGEQEGFLYLVTPYVEDGASLADAGKPLPLGTALELTRHLLAALEYAHARGIVHRDVKPSNVLLPAPNWSLLADFGIAKLLDSTSQELTSAGQVIGTAAYMAPEQAAGELVDARTDLYAVGVLLYELLTGHVPFGASPRSTVLARQTSEPPPSPRSINPALPAAVEPILLRALAKRPSERYQSAGEMAADLQRLNAQELQATAGATESATQIAPPSRPSLGSRWVPAALVLVLLAVFGIAGALAWRGGNGGGGEPPTAENPGGGGPVAQGNGRVVWRDKALWNDRVHVEVEGLPPPESGQVYAAWLIGQENCLALGALEPGDGGTLVMDYVSLDKSNLLAAYDRVYITRVPESAATTEVANVVMTGALPGEALVHIRHLLFSFEGTPNQIGFILGLRQETGEMARRAEALGQAFEAGDLAEVRRRAEQLINTIEGAQGQHFGDSDGNGQIHNPGDGFGLLENGQQTGYINGMVGHAALAAGAPDANETIKTHAAAIETIGGVVGERVSMIRDHALNILKAESVSQTQDDVVAIYQLTRQTVLGADEQQEGQVESDPKDGGVLSAYQHAQFMADTPIVPGSADDAPPPAPAE